MPITVTIVEANARSARVPDPIGFDPVAAAGGDPISALIRLLARQAAREHTDPVTTTGTDREP